MLLLLKKLFQRQVKFLHKAMNPPQHFRPSTFAADLDQCLRNLEKEARLPSGDLYIKGEPMKFASWPQGFKILSYPVSSKTSDAWEADDLKLGYICGSVTEPSSPPILGDKRRFFGSLHISNNCPGVFRNNVCTSCGHHD